MPEHPGRAAERCQDLVHTLAGDQAVEVLDVRANLLGIMAPTASGMETVFRAIRAARDATGCGTVP